VSSAISIALMPSAHTSTCSSSSSSSTVIVASAQSQRQQHSRSRQKLGAGHHHGGVSSIISIAPINQSNNHASTQSTHHQASKACSVWSDWPHTALKAAQRLFNHSNSITPCIASTSS
jgi:hypothetical protein